MTPDRSSTQRPEPRGPRILVSAGEASGDLHASQLASVLRGRDPSTELFGMGGDLLRSQGCDTVVDSREISVMGISEVLRELPRLRGVMDRLVESARVRRPDVAVLVDLPDFNLRLAKRLRELDIPVVYYVSPQIWAWRKGRVKTIARLVDRMLVLFPFELEFYEGHGVAAHHVGHPLVDEVPRLGSVWDREERPERYRVALLPGSRNSEVRALLPVLLEAVARMGRSVPLETVLILAPTVDESWVREQIAGQSSIEVHRARSGEEHDRFAELASSHLALCASGTATLEVGLLGVPTLVVYKLRPMTYWLSRLLVRVPHISLVNLILEDRVFPELVQDEASPSAIAHAGIELLTQEPVRAQMLERLSGLRPRLGEGGASERAADWVLATLGGVAQ